MKYDWSSSKNFIFSNHFSSQSLLAVCPIIEPFCVFQSSGTTAAHNEYIKWIVLKKEALLASANAVNNFLQVSKQDIWFQALPYSHVGGAGVEARAYLSQSEVIDWRGKNPKWNLIDFYKKLSASKATLISLVPTQVFDLVKSELKAPGNLRAAIVGGAALSEKLYFSARELGWPILPSFGMTEAGSQIATANLTSLNNGDQYPKLNVLSHFDVRSKENQRLWVKGESLFSGWVFQSTNSKSEFFWKNAPLTEGWYETEDLAEISSSAPKTLSPLGRANDIFKIGGELVSLYSLQVKFQNIRDQFKSVKDYSLPEMIILPIDNERLGKHIELFVEGTSGQENKIQKVLTQFNNIVKPFEKIRKVNYISIFPRSALGKVMRAQLISQ